MGNKIKISIIVAAFNVEEYIDRCLESLTNQDLDSDEYEIIIVNDGSTDSTLEKLNDWKSKFENIIVISQKNKGQSAARNTALKQATGDYVFYVDADDYILVNCLNLLLISSQNADILRFDFNNNTITFKGKYNKCYTGVDFFENCFGIWSPCMQIFKRSFLINNKLFFVEGMTSEDAELIPKAYLLATSAVAIPDKIYNYVFNPNSTTKDRNFDYNRICRRIESQLKVLQSCTDLMSKYKDFKKVGIKLNETVVFPTFTAYNVMLLLDEIPYKTAKEFQNRYLKSDFFPVVVKQKITLKQAFMYKIMNSELLFSAYYKSGLKYFYTKFIHRN